MFSCEDQKGFSQGYLSYHRPAAMMYVLAVWCYPSFYTQRSSCYLVQDFEGGSLEQHGAGLNVVQAGAWGQEEPLAVPKPRTTSLQKHHIEVEEGVR